MARLGTERANLLLREIATELGLSLMLGRVPSRQTRAARRDFAVRGRALGITINTLAAVLGVNRNTLMAYSDPALRERKTRYQRYRRAMARDGRQPSGWNIPVWNCYRHLPSIEFHEGPYDAITN
jgi:hypothetical protein